MGSNTTDKIVYPIVLSNEFSIKTCKVNPKILFVFGDNEERVGLGGQAIIRQQDNTIGIATKASPGEYWDDENYDANCEVIETDIQRVILYFREKEYEAMCFPKMGFGTGLANLHVIAPRTFIYLTTKLLEVFQYNNMRGLKSN